MARSAIMSVRITGNSDDAVKAFSKVTGKAAAFGSFMGGMAVKGVTALWDKLKGFSAAVVDMSDSTDKFKQTMGFAGLDTTAIDQATKAPEITRTARSTTSRPCRTPPPSSPPTASRTTWA